VEEPVDSFDSGESVGKLVEYELLDSCSLVDATESALKNDRQLR
jgi:hypothetical protein